LTTQEEFDPLAYIESAFREDKKEPLTAEIDSDEDFKLPSIGEFLGKKSTKPAATKAPRAARKQDASGENLSSPRPRRVRNAVATEPTIDPELQAIWSRLPRNIEFLSTFFDDKVTANYYTGEFKESRQELIQRLLDPELTLEEVSRLLGVCPATVRRYTNRNWLEHHRTQGGQRRFRLSGVVKFVESHGRVTD